MTNGIYFYDTIREEWSASTSPNETPRPSFVHAGGDPTTTLVEEASSSTTSTSGAIGLNPNGHSVGGEWESFNLKSFSFKELQTATRNFRPDGFFDEGAFRRVYKGWIDQYTLAAAEPGRGIPVAVKWLDQHEQGFKREIAEVEWWGYPEVNYLRRLYHPNLVRLYGYCSEYDENLLVYEFMPQRSLDYHLFSRSLSGLLSWSLRMKIALGVAKALAFLHTAQVNVIYRDLKCSHILLDSDYNAKLSSFWLAVDGSTGVESEVPTVVMGTYGYAAPEYIATGYLTAKCDVYSFGVVLLELLSGRRTIDRSKPSREQNLVEWARPYLNHKKKISKLISQFIDSYLNGQKISLFIDSHLNGQCTRGDALKAASLAYRCLSPDPKRRPNMNEVAKALEELQMADYTSKPSI